MSVVRIIHLALYIIDAVLVAYLVIDLACKRHQFLKGKIEKIKSAKYLVLIVIILGIFIVHGYMRNFRSIGFDWVNSAAVTHSFDNR